MLFETTNKRCPSCGGDVLKVNLDKNTQYICDTCDIKILVPIHENGTDNKKLLKG